MADAPATSAVHLAAARRGRHNTLLAWLVPSVLLALMMWLVFNTTQAVEKISLQVMQQGHVIDAINSLLCVRICWTWRRGNADLSSPGNVIFWSQMNGDYAKRRILATLNNLIGGGAEAAQMADLTTHVMEKLKISQANVAARMRSFEDAQARVNARTGKLQMDLVRQVLNDIERVQLDNRSQLRVQRKEALQQLWVYLVGVSIVLLLLMAYLYAQAKRFQKAQQASYSLAQHLATHDALTGLPNRCMLQEELGRMISRAQRNQKQCVLLFLDLNGFKRVNDTLGHQTGDVFVGASGRAPAATGARRQFGGAFRWG